MAIGSDPEIGKTFTTLGSYPSVEELLEWHKRWRDFVGDDLLGGYATLCYPK